LLLLLCVLAFSYKRWTFCGNQFFPF